MSGFQNFATDTAKKKTALRTVGFNNRLI